MEGVEAKIEWRINEDCLMEFRTRRSGGFAGRSGYCGGGFQLSTILACDHSLLEGRLVERFSRSYVSMND